jgi:hypothetical protein
MLISNPSLTLAYRPQPQDSRCLRQATLRRKSAPVWNVDLAAGLVYPSPPMSRSPSQTRQPPELSFPSSTSGERNIPPAPTSVVTSAPTYLHERPTATSATFGSSPYTPRALQGYRQAATLSSYPPAAVVPGFGVGVGEPAIVQYPPSPAEGESFSARGARKSKTHVASACVNCKRAHLSCDVQRPCARCVASGKQVGQVELQVTPERTDQMTGHLL